ncbi:MAG TPA: C2H2-type zinc finger protein [Thermoplasmata archaeon]|nr:C2H2-type zinc finger protein [Thermoplasmata archaeon]
MPYIEYDEVEAACSDCGRLFRSEEALASHRAESHPPDAPARSMPTAQVVCAVCRKKFTSVSALSRHNRSAHTA